MGVIMDEWIKIMYLLCARPECIIDLNNNDLTEESRETFEMGLF